MNRPQMIQWLHEQASGPMANDPRQVDTCNTLTAIRLELERLATRRQEIDDEAAGYAEEIETLRAALAEARGYETMPCGHNSRWLVYGNPVDVNSERHCVFCEIEALQAIVDRLPKTADGVPVTPGSIIWMLRLGYPTEVTAWEFHYYESNGRAKIWHAETVFGVLRMYEAYSTREAAEKVAKEQGK